MKLPNSELVLVEKDKIVNYLLCADHPDGGSKARFFQRFGFTIGEWPALVQALSRHGQENEVIIKVESSYGMRYTVEGLIEAPDGRKPRIRTVWIIEKEEKRPRLITAHPA